MGYFVLSRYGSASVFLSSRLPFSKESNLGDPPFREQIDAKGNYRIEIDAQVIEVTREAPSPDMPEQSFLVLQSKGVKKPFKVGLGPDIQHRSFRNEKLLQETTQEGVIVSSTIPVTEIASLLNPGDSILIQLGVISEHASFVESWKAFFNSNNGEITINYNFVRSITLLPS